jgi:hypothetical protein
MLVGLIGAATGTGPFFAPALAALAIAAVKLWLGQRGHGRRRGQVELADQHRDADQHEAEQDPLERREPVPLFAIFPGADGHDLSCMSTGRASARPGTGPATLRV